MGVGLCVGLGVGLAEDEATSSVDVAVGRGVATDMAVDDGNAMGLGTGVDRKRVMSFEVIVATAGGWAVALGDGLLLGGTAV
jgi:hypothetical protein